jgi:hypothetical protein
MASQNFPSAIPILTVGGRVFTDLANLIILTGGVGGAGNGNSTLRRLGGSAGYTPSVGKTFRALAVRVTFNVAGSIYLGYADNDAGTNGSTAFTNLVYVGSNIANGVMAASVAQSESPVDFTCPNGKYPATTNAAGAANGTILVFGYEV